MPRFKDFGTGGQALNSDPISFKLYGEEFHCVPNIQGKVLLELVADSSSNDPSRSTQVITRFFSKVLTAESLVRFNDLVESTDKIVPVDVLTEITAWLIEEYTDRPTAGPQDS